MTVSTEVDHNDYTGNGVTTAFPYTFRIYKKSDLLVTVTDLNENITQLVLDTNYNVTGAGTYQGGNVVLTAPLANGWRISISRELPVTQDTDLRNQGKFFAEVHEDAFDKLTMLIQQVRSRFSLALRKPSTIANYYDALGNYIRNLRDPRDPQDAATKGYVDYLNSYNFNRTIRVPETNVNPLQNAVMRANHIMAFDNAGNPITVLPSDGSASDVMIDLAKPEGAYRVGYKQSNVGNYLDSLIDYVLVTDIVPNLTTDSRSIIFGQTKKVYVPSGVSVRCNLLPEDDVRIFVGEGVVLTRDPWGHEHVFDIYKATEGSDFTVNGVIHQGLERKGAKLVSIGVLGDSITDGAWGKQSWGSPPEGPSPQRNLISTNYDHSANGGSHSWFAHFVTTLNLVISRWTSIPAFKGCNCSLSGEKLIDGWAYRNFDYGFFQNSAYGNSAPAALLISMGWNDVDITDFEKYADDFDAVIRKAWGYGCAVGLVTVNMNENTRAGLEGAVKRTLSQKYNNLDYFDLGTYLAQRANSDLRNLRNYFIKVDGTYDYTHPQPLGQADVGNAMLWNVCRDTFIPSVKSGEMVSWVNADKWWDCVGATTGTHYPLNWINAGGTPSLEKMGKIVQATPFTENVTMNTFVFCEEDDMSLSILEPFTFEGDYTTSSRVHNVTVYSPAGKVLAEPAAETLRTLHLSQRLASGILGTQKTLTTFVGRLRYGINHVQVVYDGKPTSVFIPGLIFGRMSQARCSFDNIRLSKAPASVSPYFTRSKPLDGITSNLFDGSQFATLPDWFSSGDNLVGCLTVNEALADLSGVILCYKEDGQSGIAIQRSGSTIRVGEMSGGNVSSWTATAVSGTTPFKVHFYQSSGTTKGVSISIVGSGLYEGVFARSGGLVGAMNQGAGWATYNLSYSAIDLGS